MKRVYEKPEMICDMFTPDEYVAACGQENKAYDFSCDADASLIGFVYNEQGDLIELGYANCGSEKHVINDLSMLKKGYIRNLFESGLTPIPVYYWVDDEGIHCTRNVQEVESWLTERS